MASESPDRPSGEADAIAGERPVELIDRADLLTTKGIESQVLSDDERIGHILLADYDNAGVTDEQMSEDIDGLGGITLLFESSEGSWHLWNLSIRTREGTATRLLDLRGADAKHVAIGWRYGKWTLRTGPKTDYNGTDHKSAPTLVRAFWNETNRPQSRAHWNFAKALHGIPDPPFEDEMLLAGDSMSLSHYQTITEHLKREVWGDD